MSSPAVPAELSPEAAAQHLQAGALLVDIREAGEVAHLAFDLPEMLAVPMSELGQRLSELPQDRELVFACLSGARSRHVAHVLAQQGWPQPLANLTGGISAWMRAGLPVSGPAAPQR